MFPLPTAYHSVSNLAPIPELSFTHKRTLTFALAVVAFAFFSAASSLWAAVTLPVLTWTPRSDWLNVKSAPFNAVGDGVADDTNAIQGALTLAGTCNSGGTSTGTKRTVYLPAGTYKISQTLNWKGTNIPWTYGGSGLQLIGCGQNTTITWSGSSGAAMFLSDGATCANYIGINWDGKNLAGAGYLHNSTIHYEDPVRHENEAFYNFTVNGTYISGTSYPPAGIMNGLANSTTFTADALVWSCLFNNCTNGIVVGNNVANNYQWCIEGCEFENCGTGVLIPDGMTTIFDCHFQGSTVVDIQTSPSLSQSIRTCTSKGSKAFFTVTKSASYGPQKIQDCRIDSWTSTTAAIELDGCGPTLISDCVFTNPPNTAPPIRLNNNQYGTATLLTSNNYCPPPCTALVAPGSYSRTNDISPGSLGGTVAVLSSATTTFLQPTWISDSANIIDVTGTSYNADPTGVADSTTAIQNAINAANTAANGSIVYLPCGKYKVTSTLTASGSNYTIQGSGFKSILVWSGTSTGTVIAVTTPQNLSLEQLNIACAATVTAIKQTGTTGGVIVYDGIENTLPDGNSTNTIGAGVQLVSLPAGSLVFLGHVLSALTVNDCGPAEIFGRYVENGQMAVKGATQPKTGFLGISNSMQGQSQDSSLWDILVDDNQDLAIGHIYQENGYNHLKANRGAGTGSGRITLQGVKNQTKNSADDSILINNYQGQVMYGPTFFANTATTFIAQTGSNLVNLILPGDQFRTCAPTFTIGTSCQLIQTMNVYGTSPVTFPTDVMPTGGMAATAAGFDHLRQLFAEDLKLIHGIQNVVANSFFETDPVNPSPLTTMGVAPASWVVTGTAIGAGVRTACAVTPGSPFGAGGQSIAFVDTTGTTAGKRLAMSQYTAALPPTTAAVYSFDVLLNSMTSLNDDVWLTVFAGGNSVTDLNIHLTANSTSGSFGPAPLALNTWYRIRAAIPAPSLGATNITLYVTPWTASGPGTTSTYTVAGKLTAPATSGFSEIYWNVTAAGAKTNINLDNITLVTGDPLSN